MVSTELRLGNLIKDGLEYERVTIRVLEMLENGEAEFDGIELSPDILEAAGFDPSLRLDIGELSFRYYAGHGVNISYREHPDVVNVKYLHHLQNCFYALTGSELTIQVLKEKK